MGTANLEQQARQAIGIAKGFGARQMGLGDLPAARHVRQPADLVVKLYETLKKNKKNTKLHKYYGVT